MNTKLVMTSSAFFLFAAGILLSFLPQEIAGSLRLESTGVIPILLQMTGALYFASGMVNWTAKEMLIGGVYGRPVAIGNLTHFLIGALVLIKSILNNVSTPVLFAAAVIYTTYAVLFGMMFFRQPTPQQ